MTKMTDEQRDAQKRYIENQIDRGYFQARVWLPEDLRDWHTLLARRLREWKEFGVPVDIPTLPKGVRKVK